MTGDGKRTEYLLRFELGSFFEEEALSKKLFFETEIGKVVMVNHYKTFSSLEHIVCTG